MYILSLWEVSRYTQSLKKDSQDNIMCCVRGPSKVAPNKGEYVTTKKIDFWVGKCGGGLFKVKPGLRTAKCDPKRELDKHKGY